MAETLDTRRFGSEVKFVVDAALAPRVRAWARAHLQPDPHGDGPHGDEYTITTLYLDTPEFDVYRRRGSYGRSKYRIRRYADGDLVFVERKMRNASRLVKRRTVVPSHALARLAHVNGTAHDAAPPSPSLWFERRIGIRRLRPVCQVSYSRMARTFDDGTGVARLTVDDAVRATPAQDLAFVPDSGTAILTGDVVVELKYAERLPALMRRLVEDLGLAPRAASKYRAAIEALQLAPVDAAAEHGTARATHA